jgi:hypothetical protein
LVISCRSLFIWFLFRLITVFLQTILCFTLLCNVSCQIWWFENTRCIMWMNCVDIPLIVAGLFLPIDSCMGDWFMVLCIWCNFLNVLCLLFIDAVVIVDEILIYSRNLTKKRLISKYIPLKTFRIIGNEDSIWNTCSICSSEFEVDKDIIREISNCGHRFHENCIQSWIQYTPFEKLNCPNCRRSVFAS